MGEAAKSYFEVYAERSNFDRFMGFYADDASLTDVIYGNELAGKEEIRNFFDWGRGDFKVTLPGPILVVQEQVVTGNVVVSRGVFRKFEYGSQVMGPWQFVIWQEWDSAGKISRQEDWINYTPKKILIGG